MASIAKTATAHVYVTFAGLLVTILTLASALVRLVVTLVNGLVSYLERPARAPDTHGKSPKRPNLRVVQATPSKTEQVAFALRSVGYRTSDVQKVLATLGPQVETLSVVDSIKEALKLIAPSTTSRKTA
jgi:hypothetical protein